MPKIPSQQSESRYQIYNEGCFETFKRIPSASVNLVLCDPPFGTTACAWDEIISLAPMWKELLRVIKPNGAIILMSTQPFTTKLIHSGFRYFKYSMVWAKSRAVGFTHAHNMPLRAHEDISLFSKGVVAHDPKYGNKITYKPQGLEPLGKIVNGCKASEKDSKGLKLGRKSHKAELFQEFTGYPTSVIKIGSEGKGDHPTQKPVELMEYLIMTYSYRDDLVIDFAFGSGTTGVACGNLNRRFIGCDNDTTHGYFEIAKKRISEAYAKNSK